MSNENDQQIITIDDQIKQEVAKFNLPRAAIAELKQEFEHLTIVDINDKQGYNQVKKALQVVRSKRTAVEKKRQELKRSYLEIGRMIDNEAKELTALLLEIEMPLSIKKAEIDKLIAEAEEAKERAEKQRLLDRLEKLENVGMRYDGNYYSIGGTISMDAVTIRNMTDDQFDNLVNAVMQKKRELDEIEAREAAERERLEQERLAREQEVQRKQQDLLQQQEELRRQQEELRRQQEEIIKARHKLRTAQLINIGLSIVGDGFCFKTPLMNDEGLWISKDVLDTPEQDFNLALGEWEKTIFHEKKRYDTYLKDLEEEAKALEDKKTRIAKVMEAIGLAYRYGEETFVFENECGTVAATMQDLLNQTPEDLELHTKQLAADIVTLKQEAATQREALRVQQETQAKAAAAAAEAARLDSMNDQELFNSVTQRLWEVITAFQKRTQSKI